MIHMPWGKFRGEPLEAIPTSYLAWVLESATAPSPALVRGIKQELAKRFDLTAESRPPLGGASVVAVPVTLRESIDNIVTTGFRAVAQRMHPDHGGTSQAMRTALEARAFLRRALTMT
jgi:hypothetical protein